MLWEMTSNLFNLHEIKGEEKEREVQRFYLFFMQMEILRIGIPGAIEDE